MNPFDVSSKMSVVSDLRLASALTLEKIINTSTLKDGLIILDSFDHEDEWNLFVLSQIRLQTCYIFFKNSARFIEDEVAKEVCLRLEHEYNDKASLKDIINNIKYEQ